MRTHRRSAEEWRSIVDSQKGQDQTDAEYALSQGVGVASLRAWRTKFKNQGTAGAGVKLVEVGGMLDAAARLTVILPNGIKLEVTCHWPMEHLGRLVEQLRSL